LLLGNVLLGFATVAQNRLRASATFFWLVKRREYSPVRFGFLNPSFFRWFVSRVFTAPLSPSNENRNMHLWEASLIFITHFDHTTITTQDILVMIRPIGFVFKWTSRKPPIARRIVHREHLLSILPLRLQCRYDQHDAQL
jgi:hypothetical protein